MNVVDHLVTLFRTQKRLAEAAGRSQSSIADWKAENLIPSRAQRNLLANADRFGVDLKPEDFFPEWRPRSAKQTNPNTPHAGDKARKDKKNQTPATRPRAANVTIPKTRNRRPATRINGGAP